MVPIVTTLDPRHAADAAAVDAFLDRCADATPFHRPAWLAGTAKGCGQDALLLAVRDSEGAIAALLPLTIVHSPLFGRALVSSGFAVGGGILSAVDGDRAARALAHAAVALSQERCCPTIELRGGHHPGPGWIERTDSHVGFVRPIAADDEAELLAIPRKHRAEVRKGLERGFRIVTGQDETLRAAHYALYCRSVHNLGTPVFPRSLFDGVLDAFGADADILAVMDGDKPVSAVLSLYDSTTVYPYWQGADRDARSLRANEMLYFALMRHARERGCKQFDFGRSKTGSGPATYKKNWGFEPQPLRYFSRAWPGHEPRDINPLSPRYAAKIALWKALPAGLADRIGPWIARGLG